MTAIDVLGQLFHRGRSVSDFLNFNKAKAEKWQTKTLSRILFKARFTEFGKKHGFEQILIDKDLYQSFAKHVPISDYSSMHPFWVREFNGESDVTWPGQTPYFALSSGTSEGSSKIIPVSQDQIKYIRKGSLRQLFAIFKTDVPKDFFARNYMMIGGSTDLNFNGKTYSGDLSGITTRNVPPWFERFTAPSLEIRAEKDWHIKVQKIVEAAPTYDVTMLAGGPAWIKIILSEILKKYKLRNIHEIWPNLSVFIWGAVALEPYKKQIDALMGKPIKYFETYMASEGFIAFQTKEDSKGMKLIFRNGIFYEFVPFDLTHFDENNNLLPTAKALSLEDVEENVEYALLITTSSGAWRYMIGDTIKFTSLENCEIKITGRTKHFLSICGEHMSIENMNAAISMTADKVEMAFPEFTVKAVAEGETFAHHWYLATNMAKIKASEETIQKTIDHFLCELNDDYATERKHALKNMTVTLLPEKAFVDWMAKHGKLNGQAKIPRVLSNSQYELWLQHIQEYKTNGVNHF